MAYKTKISSKKFRLEERNKDNKIKKSFDNEQRFEPRNLRYKNLLIRTINKE